MEDNVRIPGSKLPLFSITRSSKVSEIITQLQKDLSSMPNGWEMVVKISICEDNDEFKKQSLGKLHNGEARILITKEDLSSDKVEPPKTLYNLEFLGKKHHVTLEVSSNAMGRSGRTRLPCTQDSTIEQVIEEARADSDKYTQPI